MTDLNDYNVIGRLTHDLDERSFSYTPSGTARMNVSIAVNKSVKKNNEWTDEVYYFEVLIWGKTAENLKPYMSKGKQIAVNGYWKQDRWKDKETGNNRSKVYIVADSVQLLGGKDNNTGNGGSYNGYQNNGNYGGNTPQFTPAANNAGNADMGTSDEFPEDIPF